MLNPLAPHITSEMYEIVFNDQILDAKWPEYQEKYLVEDNIEVPIQVNGKLRARIMVNVNASKEEIEQQALNAVKDYLNNGEYKKIIYVPNKIFNIVV